MGFFNETKNFGLVVLIIGIIQVIAGIWSALDDVVVGIGAIICGALVAYFGYMVRSGSPSKIESLAKYIAVLGLVEIISGICTLDIANIVVGIIIGIILLFCAKCMLDGKASLSDKIIWILILIFSILGVLFSLMMFLGEVYQILLGILNLILYIFILAFLFDSDVKSKMGM